MFPDQVNSNAIPVYIGYVFFMKSVVRFFVIPDSLEKKFDRNLYKNNRNQPIVSSFPDL